MQGTPRFWRNWRAAGLAAACFAFSAGASHAMTAEELEMKSLGTTENINPVVAESFKRFAAGLTPEQRDLALKCWKDNGCETGHGDLTVALADGFGENVWRQVTKMEFIMEALSYPEVSKIIYTSARADPTKAISDLRGLIAQGADVIVVFADASTALLPTIKEATEAGITVVLHNGTYVGGEPGTDFLATVSEDLCKLGTGMVDAVKQNAGKDEIAMVELGGTPGNGLSAAWQKCADEEVAKVGGITVLGKADTNWTQEGTFQAMSGFLAQNDSVDGVIYEYADGFRGGLRAWQEAGKEPNVVVALRTDEQGLFCDWEKANDPDFKIFFASGHNFQSGVALTAAMMKRAGQDVPVVVDIPFSFREVVKGMCNPDLPQDASVSTRLDADMLKAMFAQ
ncbi:MAG: substrate-binding domain-containing protein [Bauldia sp.]|nr:substrate-binding domain-containing protein [Bauldia sp.]